MGQVKKPATPLMDDEKELGEDEDVDGDLDMGFVARRWAVVPKDMEGPEPEFLAKRRKGLPSVYTGATGPLSSTPRMRKTKIRKVDTEGNSYIWEVLVPDGQAVDGEIVEEETSPTQAPAPGTVVEGLGVVNAEGVVIAGDQAMPVANRRRPPPPKRKAKGPGRGRKKKVAFTPGTEGNATANGVAAVLNGSSAGADDGKSARRKRATPDGDTEVGDENVLQEGEEGSEEVSEGEEGEDGDREEGELSPSPTPAKSPTEPPTIVVNDIKVETAEIAHNATPSPATVPLSSLGEPMLEESSDPMLLDEDDDEPTSHSFSEPTVSLIVRSTDPTTDVAPQVAAEVLGGTMFTPESLPMPAEAIVEVSYDASITEPQAEGQLRSVTTPLLDTIMRPLAESEERIDMDKATETLVEQPTESLAEFSVKRTTEPTPDDSAERIPNHVDVSTVEAVAKLITDTPTDITENSLLKTEIDDTESMPASSAAVMPGPMTNTISTPTDYSMTEPTEEPEIETPFEYPTKSETKFVRDSEHMAMQPVDEQSFAEQSVIERPMTELPVIEPPVTEPPVTEPPATKMPVTEQTVTEQTVSDQPVTEQSVIGYSMIEQPVTEISVTEEIETEQSVMENSVTEQPVTEISVTEQSMTEPWARPTTEPFPEAVSPERRFSYTRVTTSPQAPTPSPPTPIENTFGLKAPYLSPRAPTMSPPTPIERSMSSSPDIPLADQHFRLPPQIDAAQEADQASMPDMLVNPSAIRAANVDTRVDAQIVVERGALNGNSESGAAEESGETPQHFTDGEEDLLGSLERSLGKLGGRP